ncbi:MAG: SDR family oxidoreductase [Pseudomonadales bacterium]|nr:SDR family oxidoreductase [Pseudomonadales bacterium]
MKSISALMNLSGKIGLITGGAGHIALAMSEALAEQGANLILIDLDHAGLIQRQSDLESRYPITVSIYECDFDDRDSTKYCYDTILKKHTVLDFIINNAAFVGTRNLEGWCTAFEDQSIDTWRSCLEVNLTAPFFIVQSLLPLLQQSSQSSIINISSIYGILGPDYSLYSGTDMGNPGAYAASKGGLCQVTRWMSTTLAPKIRVNSLVLGGIARGQDQTFVNRYEAKTPLQRMGTEEDIKGAIVYLVSSLSAYVTGQQLAIDGGWSAW